MQQNHARVTGFTEHIPPDSIVEAAHEMGGCINAHSDGPGLGASFSLELPLARMEVAA